MKEKFSRGNGCKLIIIIIIIINFFIFVEFLHYAIIFLFNINYTLNTCYGYGGMTFKFTFCPLLQTYSQIQFFVLRFGQ